MQVQIFGVRKSSETRKALRFFSERRVTTHFVDLNEKAASRGELTRFVQKFGIEAVLDRDSKRFGDLGLRSAHYGEAKWMEILVEEPHLLRIPLVRMDRNLTIGVDEATWKGWVGK